MLSAPQSMVNKSDVFKHYIGKLIDGDIAEFGVRDGGDISYLQPFGRVIWAFDTFDGLPPEDWTKDLDHDKPGDFKPTHDVVAYLESLSGLVVKKGRFIDTLPTITPGVVFALVYIDADYYISFKQMFEYLIGHNHVQAGTVFVFDDYDNCKGAKKAVDEFKDSRVLMHGNQAMVW